MHIQIIIYTCIYIHEYIHAHVYVFVCVYIYNVARMLPPRVREDAFICFRGLLFWSNRTPKPNRAAHIWDQGDWTSGEASGTKLHSRPKSIRDLGMSWA